MSTRVTRLEASRLLKISPSTVDRRIERGELVIEKEPHGSRNRTWVVLEDAIPEDPGESSPDHSPSITTTLPQFGQFLGGTCFAEGKATKLSSVWSGRHEEVLKVPLLRTVVVILEVWPETPILPKPSFS